MLPFIESAAGIAFNVVSVLAIGLSAWWFLRRGLLGSNLSFEVKARHVTSAGAVPLMEVQLEEKNIGASSAWIAQTVLTMDYYERESLELGVVADEPTPSAIFFEGQSDSFAIVPSATVTARFLVRAPANGEVAVARFFLFPGKTTFPVKDGVDLRRAIACAGNNYYFDSTVLDLAPAPEAA